MYRETDRLGWVRQHAERGRRGRGREAVAAGDPATAPLRAALPLARGALQNAPVQPGVARGVRAERRAARRLSAPLALRHLPLIGKGTLHITFAPLIFVTLHTPILPRRRRNNERWPLEICLRRTASPGRRRMLLGRRKLRTLRMLQERRGRRVRRVRRVLRGRRGRVGATSSCGASASTSGCS